MHEPKMSSLGSTPIGSMAPMEANVDALTQVLHTRAGRTVLRSKNKSKSGCGVCRTSVPSAVPAGATGELR